MLHIFYCFVAFISRENNTQFAMHMKLDYSSSKCWSYVSLFRTNRSSDTVRATLVAKNGDKCTCYVWQWNIQWMANHVLCLTVEHLVNGEPRAMFDSTIANEWRTIHVQCLTVALPVNSEPYTYKAWQWHCQWTQRPQYRPRDGTLFPIPISATRLSGQ